MKRIKYSQIAILIIVLVVLAITVSFSFYLNDHLKERSQNNPDIWLLSEGQFFSDTINDHYDHLVSDFALLQISGRSQDLVITEGYENAKKYLNTYISNDTLYVMRALTDSDTTLVAIEDDYPVLVTVGANGLHSITLDKSGRIELPVRPFGANPGGDVVYKPEDWEKYVLRMDSLDLILTNGGTAHLFLEIKTLNLKVKSNIRLSGVTSSTSFNSGTTTIITSGLTSRTTLIGDCKKINLIHPKGMVNIAANNLKVDSLTAISNPDQGSFDSGSITVNCNDYLFADLRYDMDVAYKGDPEVVKKERNYGRVINGN